MSSAPENTGISVRLLRWSERYFKTDMVYLASGGFWLTLTQVVASIASLVLAIAFANLLSPETYGTYKYILSIIGLLTLFTLPGVDTAYIRAVARGKEDIRSPLLLQVRWGLIGGLVAFGFAGYYFLNGNMPLTGAFILTGLFIPFMDPLGIYDPLFVGRRAFSSSTKASFISRIVPTALLIITMGFSPTLFSVMFAYLAGWTVVRACIFWYAVAKHRPNKKSDESVAPYGKHLSFMKSASTLAGSLGSILLFHFGGGTTLAIFSFAIAPIEQIRGLLGNVEPLIFPKLASDNWETSSASAFLKKLSGFAFLLLVAVACYIVAAPFLFSVVFPKYAAAVVYSQAFAPSLILTALSVVLSAVLRAKHQVRKLYSVTAASIAANLICVPLFTYVAGIWGLIAANYIIKIIEIISLMYMTFWSAPVKASEEDTEDAPLPSLS